MSSAEPTKAKVSRTGSRRICIVSFARVGQHLRVMGACHRDDRLGATGAAVAGGGGLRRCGRARPLAELAPRRRRGSVLHVGRLKAVLEAGRATLLDQFLRRVAGQDLARVS